MSKRPARREGASAEPVALRERPDSRHGPVAQLMIALSPLSLILVVYAAAQWVSAPLGAHGYAAASNRLGFPLHVQGPVRADRGIFGSVPSVWLQAHLVDGSPHWYDAGAALVYSTHFVAIPLLTVAAWFWVRDRFSSWVVAVLAFATLGMCGYVAYPAAPPWLASDRGAIGTVERISHSGWDYLHLDVIGTLTVSGQGDSNPVAAMPSLHAGSAMLVALFLWPLVGAWWRAVLAGYVLLMAAALVYTGEHYVVDVVAGWLTAGAGAGVGAVVGSNVSRRGPATGRRRRRRRPR